MKKWITLLVGLVAFASSAVEPSERTKLVYGGHTFNIPKNANTMLSKGGEENILVFRYSREKGGGYLIFSNAFFEGAVKLGCDLPVFFQALFNSVSDSGCSHEYLSAFKSGLIDDSDSGVWVGKKLTVYYSINPDRPIKSILFAFDHSGKFVKIDSNFLSKAELREIIDSAL